MANYVKFKQGLKKDFNTTNQPLTNGMIYFVIDEHNNGSIYYDTIVDGEHATKEGTVHRVKFSGLPIKITGSVIGTGVISKDGETIEINTSTNHSHGLAHQDFTVTLSNDDTNLKWTRLGNQNGEGFWLKSIKGDVKAPAWFQPNYGAGIAFGGGSTKGIISVKYNEPSIRFAGGNGDAPVWYFTITGANDKTYDLSKIGGHSSDSAKLDHNLIFKIASTADATQGGNGTATDLSGSAVDLYLPTKISGFDLLQATRFQGNADTSTVAAKLGKGGNTSLPMTFYWDGSKGTQPTWLWGGENGIDMYVYNPSNFRVAHSVNTAGLDHDVTFKISKVANATTGEAGVVTKLTGALLELILPASISGFNLIQSTRFQGNADSATVASRANSLFLNPSNRQENIDYQINSDKYQSRVTYSLASSITKTGKPPVGDSHVLTFGWDGSGWGAQLAITADAKPHMAIRGATVDEKGVSIWDETWSTVLDSSNYTSYINNYYWANVKVSTASSMETKPTFNTAYTSNWWRSTGKTGWWNDTYSGGIAMEDKTYVKVAGNKSFLIPNGSLKIGGNGDIFFATGYDDATLKIYGQTNTDFGVETIVIQTCFDNRDPQTSEYTTQYANRCNLLLQPRGGQVYIGKNLTTPGDIGYKLLVGGNQWIEGNLVFKGAKEIKFIGSKQTYSMIRFIDNTSDAYGNGISIGGGGSTVIGAGESAMSYVTNGGDERLFLLSDGAINIEAGGDTISNRKGLQVTSDGHILPIKAENSNPNAQDLGSAADYWRNLYINNITLQGQVGNRLVWTNGSKILQAGYHYADTDRIAINTAGRQGYNFYVNGSSYFSSNTYIHRNYFLNNPSTGAGELVLTALGYKSAGYPVYNDPEFAKGANGISVYNNSSNGVVTHAIVSDASSGNSSGKILKITHTGSGSPGFGGFVQYISSRANAIFIQIFRAKIPTGRNVATASNSMGDNYKDEWLTPTTGTGRWEWYARRVICGASGTFSTGGYVYIKDGAAPTASSPLVWYLSYCNVIDITKGNYDGLRTRYSDFVIYDSGEDGKDNKTPINDKYVAKIVAKTSNGTTFTLRGLNGAGNELADAVLTIPNAGSGKAGLITDAAQTIYGEKTLTSNLRFANVTTGTRGIVGTIADNNYWRVVGRADKTNEGYLEIATGDDANEPIYMRQYSGVFGTVKRTFTILDGSGCSRAPELFEAKKVHVNSKLNQSTAIADISYQFQVTGTSNFTDTVNISGVTNHHNNIQIDANYSIARPGRGSNWFGSHNTAMIRMTTIDGWAPLLAQRATNGYWVLGHYNNGGEFNDQWIFGYLANSNLEGTSGAKNDLSTKYRMRNVGGEKNILFSTYNAQIGSSTNPVYIKSNGEAVACTYSLSATIEAGTANRMAYYKTANQIGSSGHYVTSNQVGINASSSKNYTFYVGGDSLFDNAVTINGNVHILPDTDVGLNGAGSLVIGNKAGQNLGIDGNEIMARNNSKASALYLNNEGGVVQVGQDGITIQAKASSTNLQSGGLRISSENAGNSGNVALELYRGNNGSWQIANEGAILYFRTNWVGEKKATYAKNTLIIDNTTGSASIPYLAIGQEERNTTYGLYVVSSQSWIKNTLWTGNVYPDTNNTRECGTNNYFWNKMNTNWLNVNRGTSQTDGGITLYGGDVNYGIIFRTTKNQGTHGYVSGDWATYFTMSNSAGRGWIFKRWGVGNVASISTDGNAYFNGHIRAASTGGSWLDGQRYNYGGYNLLDATNSESYWPWLRQTNTNTKKWFSFGILANSFYLIGSSTNRTDNGYDFGWQFDISNGNTTFNTNGNKNNTSKTVINGRLIVNPYYSTEQSYSEGIRVNRANNGWANIILGGDNGSSTGTSSTTWLIGHRGSNGTSSGSGGSNGANLTGKINDLTIEVNSSSGQGLTLPVAQGELLTWQQRPIMAQLPAQGGSATILNNANYKTAYLATTSNGNASMGLVSANWYHVMNFRHLDNNGFNSQFVLPLNHNGQAAWRLSSGTTWEPWNYIFDDNHAMIPASNNVYNIGSASNYWATGYINTLYVAGNAYANGSNRIPTTGNTTGTIGSATVPVYSDNGVLKTITSYSGNAATATTASKLSRNAGSATKPIYFSGGVPVQCNDTLGVSISGNAASATYTTQLLGVNGSNTPYSAVEGNLIRAVWNVKGDSRWYLKAGTYNCRVNYADNAGNADTIDGYHASEVYKAATHTINNYSSVNDWVQIATINIDGTDLAMGGFTAILSNREYLDGSSFILTVAIRRNSVTSASCQAFYTPIGSSSPREITIRSNDGVNFYIYLKSELNSWTTYYNVTKIMTENKVIFENTGISSTNLITGDVLKVTATRGGYVNRAVNANNTKEVWNDSSYMSFHWNGQSGQPTWLWGGNNDTNMYVYNPSNFRVSYANNAGDADTVDGYHASDLAKKTDVSNSYVKKAGDTMTGELKNSSNDFTLSSNSNEQRFKFLNASKNKHTVYFYKGAGTSSTIVGLWDSTDGQIWTYNTSGYFNLDKRVVIGGYNNSNYSLSTSSFICDSWIRTTGSTGWYNETYGGGWHMSDSTYIRNYNSKHLYITGRLGVNCELRLWEAGRQITRAGNSVAWINGRDGALIRQDSYTGYNPIFSCKTTNGSWELGPYDNNILYFTYGTDSNHKAGKNSVEHPLRLMPGKGVLLSGLNYGTSLPSSGTNGQVFFKI